jgi:hypothetical protein
VLGSDTSDPVIDSAFDQDSVVHSISDCRREDFDLTLSSVFEIGLISIPTFVLRLPSQFADRRTSIIRFFQQFGNDVTDRLDLNENRSDRLRR